MKGTMVKCIRCPHCNELIDGIEEEKNEIKYMPIQSNRVKHVKQRGHINYTAHQIRTVKRLRSEGKSYGSISTLMNIPYGSLNYITKLKEKNEIKLPAAAKNDNNGKKWRDNQVKCLLKLRSNGIIFRRIAEILGRTKIAVERKFYELQEK
jgi:hypothetical protein